MAQLEKIVEALETGNLPLESALKKFEEGMSLSRFCFEKLDETEKRISVLMERHNGIERIPFESGATVENNEEKDER